MQASLHLSLMPCVLRKGNASLSCSLHAIRRVPMHVSMAGEDRGAAKPRRTRKKKTVEPTLDMPMAGELSSPPSLSSPSTSSLHRLHGTSENLRSLLERRAERQKRDLPATTATPISQPPRPFAPSVPAEMPSQRRTAKVSFWLPFHVEYGQQIYLVGGCPELGGWILSNGVPMTWSDGDLWTATVELSAGSIVEYKYVVVGSGGHAVAWQTGNNQVLGLRSADDGVDVHDNWSGSPGAQVVAAGMAPVTRENRLLSWASEIEAQLSSQRQELRRARMELVAAQEDAKMAREESRKLKAALATSEAERLTATSNLRRAESVNHLLQAKLTETTSSFTQALEVAVGLLDKASGAPATASSSGRKSDPLIVASTSQLKKEEGLLVGQNSPEPVSEAMTSQSQMKESDHGANNADRGPSSSDPSLRSAVPWASTASRS